MTVESHAIAEAITTIRRVCDLTPRFAIVLGSGLGGLVDVVQAEVSIPYAAIPGFPLSHAAGHAGRLILGYIESVPVAVLAGRSHLYEGNSLAQATFAVRVLRGLGASDLVLSNAAGGLNPRFVKGDLIAIDQHINLLFRPNRDAAGVAGMGGFVGRLPSVYSSDLLVRSQRAAVEAGFALPTGTYLATLGPTYETRAEYRFFRKIGADMVGMSTVPEAILGAELGYRVAAFSVITNEARPDSITKTTHQEVLDVAKVAQTRLVPLVTALVSASRE